MTDTDEIERLRAEVKPILATLGAPHEHNKDCSRPECWYAVVERAAMLVVAEARASALREAVRPQVGYNVKWDADAASIRAVAALAAAEALVAELREKQGHE